MKNYFKVMSVNKNLNIFVFEDEDEVATREALLQADSVAKMYGGKIVVWALSGHVSRRPFPVVGQTFEFNNGYGVPRFQDSEPKN